MANGVKREFEHTHAERLLRMPNNGGWELPKTSEYKFENGVIVRANKGKTPRPAKKD